MLWFVAEQQVPADGRWQQHTRWGGDTEPCCSLTRGISSFLPATTAASKTPTGTRAMKPQHLCWKHVSSSGQSQYWQNKELALSLPLLAAQRVSNEAPFAMAVPSSAQTTTQVMAGGLLWISHTLQTKKHGTVRLSWVLVKQPTQHTASLGLQDTTAARNCSPPAPARLGAQGEPEHCNRQRTQGTRDQTCCTLAPSAQGTGLTCRYLRCGLYS